MHVEIAIADEAVLLGTKDELHLCDASRQHAGAGENTRQAAECGSGIEIDCRQEYEIIGIGYRGVAHCITLAIAAAIAPTREGLDGREVVTSRTGREIEIVR